MNIIEKMKKEAREAVETADIFVSRFMHDFIGAKLRLICKAFRVAVPDLTIMFDPNSDITACTSTDEMYINAGHEMFGGEDERRLLKVAGVLLHEIGHVLFTNYTAFNTWAGSISNGAYYPKTPDVPADLEASREGLLDLAQDRVYKNVLMKIAHHINNSLEDGRIENFIMKFVRNARFMTRGLVVLRQETFAEMPTFENLTAKITSGEFRMTDALFQMILHYARFRNVKGSYDPASDLGIIFEQLRPEIDSYLGAPDAISCYEAFNKILIILEETIRSDLDEMRQEAQQNAQNQQQTGSGQPSDGSSSDAAESSSQEQSSENASGSGNSSAKNEESSDGNGSGSNESEALTPEEIDAIKDAINEKVQKAIDGVKGQTVDNSDRMDADAKGSDRGSVQRRISGLASGEGGRIPTDPDSGTVEGSGSVTHAEGDDNTNVSLTLDDIARKISDEKAEDMLSSELRGEYRKLSGEVQRNNDIHKDCDITIYHYSDISQKDIDDYERIAKNIAPLVKRAVKSSNFYEKDRDVYTEDNLFSGRTIHAEKAYKKDGKIFSKTYDCDEPPKIALAVRIDASGSMHGDRIKAAQRCCVFLYEYAMGMEKRYGVKIPLYIYADSVGRFCDEVEMYVFADPKYRTAKEKYRIMKLASGGCNRDGLPISMAVKRMEEEFPSAQKVLFNITDGQPNDTGYRGKPAEDDLKSITRYCERKRIALAACAIGSDRDLIEEIYGSNHFLNISDLDALPVRLVKILKKLLK